jgi:hypothetical protein
MIGSSSKYEKNWFVGFSAYPWPWMSWWGLGLATDINGEYEELTKERILQAEECVFSLRCHDAGLCYYGTLVGVMVGLDEEFF